MTAPTDVEYKAQAVRAVGEFVSTSGELTDDAGYLASIVDTLWDIASVDAGDDLSLQFLYLKRLLFEAAIGRLSDSVQESAEGVTTYRQQRVQTLQKERDAVVAEIKVAMASTSSVVMAITRVEPVTPPLFPPPLAIPINANDPRFAGSPYFPSWRGRRWW